jgi:hypothetical protein
MARLRPARVASDSLRRFASDAEPADAQPNLAFAFAAQMAAGHIVRGLLGISGRDKARLLLSQRPR